MYCPKCATENADETKYCRSCGSNLSLVPQALTGRLPDAPSGRRRHRRHRELEHGGPAALANGITKIFMGLGFLLVSASVLLFAPAGRMWWFWMLIPAFAMLGKGVAELVSLKYGPNLTQVTTSQPSMRPAARPGEVPLRDEVLFPPPSVTEQTTRQLDPKTDPYRYTDRDAR
jgi:hypothetical protein